MPGIRGAWDLGVPGIGGCLGIWGCRAARWSWAFLPSPPGPLSRQRDREGWLAGDSHLQEGHALGTARAELAATRCLGTRGTRERDCGEGVVSSGPAAHGSSGTSVSVTVTRMSWGGDGAEHGREGRLRGEARPSRRLEREAEQPPPLRPRGEQGGDRAAVASVPALGSCRRGRARHRGLGTRARACAGWVPIRSAQ